MKKGFAACEIDPLHASISKEFQASLHLYVRCNVGCLSNMEAEDAGLVAFPGEVVVDRRWFDLAGLSGAKEEGKDRAWDNESEDGETERHRSRPKRGYAVLFHIFGCPVLLMLQRAVQQAVSEQHICCSSGNS